MENPEPIRAIQRYISERIDTVYEQSKTDKIPFRILSGKYGLLKPEDLIDWYDQKLEAEAIPTLLPTVIQQLQTQKIEKITFFGKDPRTLLDWLPYYKIMELACLELNIPLIIEFI